MKKKKIQVAILAGGKGTRLGDTTKKIPKPMVKLLKLPLLVHIILSYQKQGFSNFIILTGYKSTVISNYFKKKNKLLKNLSIKCVFTGVNTLTGTRVSKLKNYINDNNFLLTYGDGLCDVNIQKTISFHKKKNSIITMTAVRPPARFGELFLTGSKVIEFKEKYKMQRGWINGGFFVVNKEFFKSIPKKNVMLEKEPIINALKGKKVFAFKHEGFWRCIDNIRDLYQLETEFKKTKKYPWFKNK